MKEIKLTQGKFAQVDDEDYEWLNQWRWYASKSKKKFYAGRNFWSNGKSNPKSMHRLIMNNPSNMQIDHIDGNSLNNQKSNLRICNNQQNCRNRLSRDNTSSIYKGVYFDTWSGKWRAEIKVNGIYAHRKRFNLELDAAHQYDIWAKSLFGEFLGLNFP